MKNTQNGIKHVLGICLFTFVTFLFNSCEYSDPVSEIEEQLDLNDTTQNRNRTNARIVHPDDPNLDPNWNWEDPEWIVYFSNDAGSVSQPLSTVNPFYNDLIFGHADPSQIDMRLADGWMLVARDFGTSTAAPKNPWIMLYNKYRGLMRICVLKTAILLSSHQSISLSFDSSVPAPESFVFTGVTTQIATAETGDQQWVVGEFNLQGYDPAINRQARFRIEVKDAANYDIKGNGNISLSGKAQPNVKPLGTAYEVGSISSKLWDKLPDLGKDGFKVVTTALKKNPFDITAGAAGLIKSLTGSGKSSSYNISLEGTFSLTGTMSLSSPRRSISVYLNTDANNSGQYKALNVIPWGVMNYNEVVKVYYRRTSFPPFSEDSPMFELHMYTNAGFFENILSINPNIQNEIVSISAGWVYRDVNATRFTSLSSFKSIGMSQEATVFWDGTGVGTIDFPRYVAIRLQYANGDVVFNKIPVEIIEI